MSNKDMIIGMNILRPQSVEFNLESGFCIIVIEYIASLMIPIPPSPTSILPSELIYRQM